MERRADAAGFAKSLVDIDRVSAHAIVQQSMQTLTPLQFIEEVAVAALEQIGNDWQKGNIALSQVYMGGRICEELIDQILPPSASERTDQPKMAISVLADHHVLGKTIVYSLLRSSGFELLDFGTVDVDQLVRRVQMERIEILLVSVLMLPSALKVKDLTTRFADQGLAVAVIVGGAPFRFDPQLWKEVGAEAMCSTASDVIAAVRKIVDNRVARRHEGKADVADAAGAEGTSRPGA